MLKISVNLVVFHIYENLVIFWSGFECAGGLPANSTCCSPHHSVHGQIAWTARRFTLSWMDEPIAATTEPKLVQLACNPGEF